jgi:hypothetical protein
VSTGRVAVLLLGAPLLAAGIYAAAVRGLADAHYYNARTILSAAAQTKRLPEAAYLSSAQASLAEALVLEPANPLFVEQRARVHEMQAMRLPRGDPAARALLQQALGEFRAAALMRPGSPYAWAAIAALKLRLDELDFEFYGALERADRFGRWEPAVQLALADIGLASWRLLPHSARLLVLGAIARGMPRQGPELRRLAATHDALERVCADEITLRAAPTGLCVKN